jgi:hypothetical protein
MQSRGARSQKLDQARAEPRATPGRGDHQRTAHAQVRGFLADTRSSSGREHDALGGNVVD